MPSLWIIAGSTGHAIAAVLLASLAILTSRKAGRTLEGQLLVVALALTALWSLRYALAGALALQTIRGWATETVRNGAWLAVLAVYLRQSASSLPLHRSRPMLLIALALVLVAQLGFDLTLGEAAVVDARTLPVFRDNWLLRCIFALGALYFLHGFSTQRDHPASARKEAWMAAALAFMWAYDFNHYFLLWLNNGHALSVGPMRGFVMALSAAMIALALRTDGKRPFGLSRLVATRLISLGIVAVYLLVVMLMATLSSEVSSPFGRLAQFGMLFALAVAVLALIPSATLLSWLRVEISKHLFAHRYDYRTLWLRFATTVAESAETDTPLNARITRAIAEAIEASGATLYLRHEADGALVRAESWAWSASDEAPAMLDAALAARLEQSGWVVDLATDWHAFAPLLPASLQRWGQAWALAPLVHREQLLGVILIGSPPGGRSLDWEDLDVLRVVCGEAAARIAEARSRNALAEAQRFDEFNRRFAFILHDLKNLVSQMSLLASNAQRHADNPAFREDMVLTLKETATRMTELLQRLGRPDAVAGPPRTGIALGAVVRDLAPSWSAGLGLLEVEGDVARPVSAAIDALSRALSHLVRNAIEASPAGRIVRLRLSDAGDKARIEVIDQGCGMSAQFIRSELFRPFSSTKSNGFGLGAHEARLLVQSMGGSLEVESAEGKGTRFIVALPYADAAVPGSPAAEIQNQRKTG